MCFLILASLLVLAAHVGCLLWSPNTPVQLTACKASGEHRRWSDGVGTVSQKPWKRKRQGELLLIPTANGASFTFLFALPSSFLAHSLHMILLRPIVFYATTNVGAIGVEMIT
jgi:hypothetical protein